MNEVLEPIVGAPVRVEVLKHKRARRLTMRVRGPVRSVIAKVYASERASVVAHRIGSLAPGPTEVAIPTVLHVDPERHLVVLSDVPGQPLRGLLLEDNLTMCRRAGSAIGRWHAAWRCLAPPVLQPHTSEREIAILRARAEAASPPVAEAVEDAIPHLGRSWACTTVVHRDLYEEQILVDDRVGLIDLDDVAAGPPELDVGNLIAHVELLELRKEIGLTAGKRALLDGYGAVGPTLDTALLDRCRSLSLLRLACLNDDVRLAAAALAEAPLPR